MESTTIPAPARLRALDALRGFDMFWIIGGDGIASAIGALSGNDTVKAITAQVSDHVAWVGFRFYDMIFPLFLFMIGVALPYSIGKRLEAGDSKRKVLGKVLRRTAMLILLGWIYNGLLRFPGWDHFRFFGVLQRQAIGYCVAAILLIYTKPRTQAIIAVAILPIYWGILWAIKVPGYPHGDMSQWGNAANYIDRLILLPGQMYEKYGDPEGPLSMIPAVSTALIGVFAGYWLKGARSREKKAAGLALAGVVLLGLGLAWAPFFPVIKKIWTSSYVLVAGGASLELLALFYWLIDVRGWTKGSVVFTVIGMNAITIYMLTEIVDFGNVATYFLGGVSKYVPTYKPLVLGIGAVVCEWIVLYGLYRNKVFLRV